MDKKKQKNNVFLSEVDSFIINWNNKYPFDYFWRKKYNVAFGSPRHRATSFILMVIDLREDDLFKKFIQNVENSKKDDFGLTQKQIDDEFNSLDLSQFNK